MTIETVLVAMRSGYDHQELLDAVLDVVEPSDASVVLCVLHPEESFASADESFEGRASPDELATRDESAEDAARRLEGSDVPFEIRGVVGEDGEAVVSLGKDLDADLLFIQEESRTPTGKAVFGSLAQTVLLNAHCPVTFLRG